MRYDKNIEQVLSVIDKFPKSCRKNFLNNLKTLEYEYLSLDELYKLVGDSTVNALYVPFHNKVYFNDYNNTDVEINHEFFHISSRNAYSLGVVGIYMIGNNKILVGKYLNEGITDYLAHLSVNLKDIDSAYQLEFFVIEYLIKVYGDKILIPYFKGDYSKFYCQFRENQRLVVELDLFLSEIQKNIMLKNVFEEFIFLRDLDSSILKNVGLYVERIDDNDEEISLFNKWLLNNMGKIYRLYELYEEEAVYTLKKEDSLFIYSLWYSRYKDGQKCLIDELIKDIIRISRNKGVDEVNIKADLIHLLENKKNVLSATCYANKKLIREK